MTVGPEYVRLLTKVSFWRLRKLFRFVQAHSIDRTGIFRVVHHPTIAILGLPDTDYAGQVIGQLVCTLDGEVYGRGTDGAETGWIGVRLARSRLNQVTYDDMVEAVREYTPPVIDEESGGHGSGA